MSQAFFLARIGMMFAVPLGGVLWLGMGSGGEHYDVPPSQVRASLSSAYVPVHVLGSYVKGSRVTRPDNETVVTALIGDGGVELMRWVTKVEADGEGSSVSTTIEPPVGKNAERAAEAMKSNGFIMSLMNKVAQEHVDAAIEKRPFNMMAFSPAGEAITNTVPGMKEEVARANETAAMISRMEQQSRRSSSPHQAGGWGANTPRSSSTMPTGAPRKGSDWSTSTSRSDSDSDWGANTPKSNDWDF